MPITNSDLASIQAIIKPLLGQKARDVRIRVGSFVYFDFGEPITDDEGYSRAEWVLGVLHAAWYLEKAGEVIAAQEDSHDVMDQAIKNMENVALLSIEVTRPALQTKIIFEGGIVMHVFPVYTAEDHDHWWLFTPEEKVLVIGPGNSWTYHNANEPRPIWNTPNTNSNPAE